MINYNLDIIFIIGSIFFGASWGSFLNVVIARVPNNESVISPPSKCPKCGSGIKSYDNIPILSYIILRGKCRNCSNKISIQYPIVEAIGAIMGLALYFEFNLSAEYLYYFVFVFGLIALTFIDIKEWLVPLSIVWILMIVGISFPLISEFTQNTFYINIVESLKGGVLGFLIIAAIIIIYKYLRGFEALGWGDAFILSIMGIYLGRWGAVYTLFFAVVQASVIGILLIIINKKSTVPYDDVTDEDPVKNKAALPFVPFLAIGGIEYLFFGEKIVKWYLNLLRL